MKNTFQKRGFTLIEAMVAVTIVTLAIAGPLYTASRAIVAAQNSRDQLIALYLAQEGLEYVRMMRDNEYLAVSHGVHVVGANVSILAWTNFLTSISTDVSAVTQCRPTISNPSIACSFDPVGSYGVPSLSLCPAGICSPLHLENNGTSNYYTTNQNASGVISSVSFARSIQVIDILGTETTPLYPEKRIVSKVSWSFHGAPYSVTVTDHLTPWQ